jgi:hypothetical protein
MQRFNHDDLKHFLKHYPRMTIRPSQNTSLILEGIFDFSAQPKGKSEITDFYQLKILVPNQFPRNIPVVTETGQKIPRIGDYHVNYETDNSLCLGSPLRLILLIRRKPSLVEFAENCLVPYLYAVSNKLQNGGKFTFGELEHGTPGILDDYKNLFGLRGRGHVVQMLKLLSIERRYANQLVCPCGCRKKLKQCRFHKIINAYRKIATISWYKVHAESLGIDTNYINELRKVKFRRR